MPRLAQVALVAMLLLPALPAGAAEWAGRVETIDGVEHVYNPAEPLHGEQRIAPRELWRLGGLSDAPEEFFGVISDVLVEGEQVFLLDQQLSEVKVFDSAGNWLRNMGREGEGPGEFRGPVDLALLPGGQVGVVQAFPSRMVLLTTQGDPAGDMPFEPEGAGFSSLQAAERAGNDMVMAYATMQPGQGEFVSTTHLARSSADGVLQEPMASERSSMSLSNSLCVEDEWNGFGRCWAAAGDGTVYTRPEFTKYEVHSYGPDGTRTVVHREYAPHARSDEEIQRVKDNWARAIARWVREPKFEIEPNWNPVESLHPRPRGEIWVRHSRGTRDLPEGVMARLDHFAADGRYLQEIVLEGSFDPERDGLFVRGDLLFVVTDLQAAQRSLWGGGGEVDDADLDVEPLSVICYELPVVAAGG